MLLAAMVVVVVAVAVVAEELAWDNESRCGDGCVVGLGNKDASHHCIEQRNEKMRYMQREKKKKVTDDDNERDNYRRRT